MSFIILETHDGAAYAIVCTDKDGNNLVFDSREEAQAEADDYQDGLVVEI